MTSQQKFLYRGEVKPSGCRKNFVLKAKRYSFGVMPFPEMSFYLIILIHGRDCSLLTKQLKYLLIL